MTAQPNIVWLTLESVRADHTTMGGYERDTTPELQRIARRPRGRSFGRCFAQGVWTHAVSASILTGTYPSHHGAGMENDVIPAALATVPERLREVGYHTGCLSPNSHLSSATDLDRGFDDFRWFSKDSLLEVAGLRPLLKYALNVRRHGGGFTTDTRKHSLDFVMQEVAKRWVGAHEDDDRPFFLYAHYGGPHHPYHPPRRYLEPYAEDLPLSIDEVVEVGLQKHNDHLHEMIAEGCPFSEAEWGAIEALYDGEVAHTDDLVGEFFEHVRSLDIGETVFVVTADHGELFGEHGLLAHMIVTDDAVSHVPMVVHGLDGLPDGAEEGIVQHGDVMQTVLEVAGADTDGMQGVDLREERREYAVVQRGERRCRRNLERFRELNPEFDVSRFHAATLTALRTDEFRYQASDEGEDLYRLPDETTDVAGEYPEVRAELAAELEEWLATTGAPAYSSGDEREGEFTDAMKDQLADLGYLVE